MSERPSKRQLRKEVNAASNQKFAFDKKFWYSVGALGLLCGMGIFQFVVQISDFMSGKSVTRAPGGGAARHSGPVGSVDIADSAKLKDIFFSGQPYVMYCQSERTESKPIPAIVSEISGMLQEKDATKSVQVVVANCFKKMESGKTIAERFSFGKNEGFIAVFANNDNPLHLNWLQNAKIVTKQISDFTKVEITKVVYLNHFTKCQNAKSCLILNSENAPRRSAASKLYLPLVYENRMAQVVSVDTGFYDLDLGEFTKEKPEESSDYGAAVCVTKTKDETEGKDAKTIYRASWMESWEGSDPADFLKLCSDGGHENWTQLKRKAVVKAKPTKPKVVKAPPRKKDTEDEGLKKGEKEHIGRRADEDKVDDDDDLEDGEEGEGDEDEIEDTE